MASQTAPKQYRAQRLTLASLCMSLTAVIATTPLAYADPVGGATQSTAAVHQTHSGTDTYECKPHGWVFGTIYAPKKPTHGDIVAYKIDNPTESTPKLTKYGSINDSKDFTNYVVRASSGLRFYAWNANDELFTFTWGTSGLISRLSEPITPPTPMTFAKNRQLRTVDEAGNIYHVNAHGDLVRSTVHVTSSNYATFTTIGEVLVPRHNMPGNLRALWASGDGVIHMLSGSYTYTMKIDLTTHRIQTRLARSSQIKRDDEYYVASIGGSVDYALARAKKQALRYRYNPANNTNPWPESQEATTVDEFADFSSFTGLMDGCTRADLNDVPMTGTVALADDAQTTFTKAGHNLYAACKYYGAGSGWGKTSATPSEQNATRISQQLLPAHLQVRPPIALSPEGEQARMFAHTRNGTVITALTDETKPVYSNIGGNFPLAPEAVTLRDNLTIIVGIDTFGAPWYTIHTNQAVRAWTQMTGHHFQPTTKLTLHPIDASTARYFALNPQGHLVSGLLYENGTLTAPTALPDLPDNEQLRPGVGITTATGTMHIAVASTTGTMYHLNQTPTGWDTAWANVGPKNYTPGIPGIFDDVISGKSYIFARNHNNKLNYLKKAPTATGTYDAPEIVPGMQRHTVVDNPIMKSLTINDSHAFGTVVRTTLGETWLVHARYGTPPVNKPNSHQPAPLEFLPPTNIAR